MKVKAKADENNGREIFGTDFAWMVTSVKEYKRTLKMSSVSMLFPAWARICQPVRHGAGMLNEHRTCSDHLPPIWSSPGTLGMTLNPMLASISVPLIHREYGICATSSSAQMKCAECAVLLDSQLASSSLACRKAQVQGARRWLAD